MCKRGKKEASWRRRLLFLRNKKARICMREGRAGRENRVCKASEVRIIRS